ncbi:MAG: hypothetical protein LIO76_01465, partial [Clostridiales bacterium]|nr:hypothetical protein [Clostridiales bacterium]
LYTGANFTNTYTAGSVNVQFGGTKTITGLPSGTTSSEKFTFKLTETTTGATYTDTATTTGAGSFTFNSINYKTAGTHTYMITEEAGSADGYDYSKASYTVKVEVKDTGNGQLSATVTGLTADANTSGLYTGADFTNTYMTADINLALKAQKSMARTDSKLGTFEFELKDVDGNVLETVKNDSTGAISFSNLTYTQADIGKTYSYTVSEKAQTGTGYLFDKTVYTVKVAVADNGDGTLNLTTTVDGKEYTDTSMTFTNDVTSVKISKVDVTTEKELPGATIQIVDEDGDVIDEWTSTDQPHEVTGLKTGETYTLVETVAPDGYEITTNTTFTLNADGTIDTSKTTTTISDEGVLLVEDQMTTSETAEISVTKKLRLDNGDSLIAKDQTFYVGLYVDAACTNLYESQAIAFKGVSSSTVNFTGLEVGRTYYIAECDEDGVALTSGYAMLADGTKYMPNFSDGSMTASVTAEDESQKTVTFTNVFYSVPDGFYKEAILTITKKLLGTDGNALKGDAVFYAGIYSDASYTTLATNVDQNIVTLALAGGSEVSVEVSVSLEDGESMTLYVTEVQLDENGNPVPVANVEGFQYTWRQDTTEVTLSGENLTASVTITNQEISETSEEESSEEEETETETESEAVKTGDESPLAFYFSLMLMAAAVMLAEGIYRKKRINR